MSVRLSGARTVVGRGGVAEATSLRSPQRPDAERKAAGSEERPRRVLEESKQTVRYI